MEQFIHNACQNSAEEQIDLYRALKANLKGYVSGIY